MGIARGHSFSDSGPMIGGQPVNTISDPSVVGFKVGGQDPFGGLAIPSVTPSVGPGLKKTVFTPGKIPSDQTKVTGQPSVSMPKDQSTVLTDPKTGWKFNPTEEPGMALNQPDSVNYRHKVLGENNKIGAANENEYYRVHKQEETWRNNVDAEQRDPSVNPNAAAYVTNQDALQKRIMNDPEVQQTINGAGLSQAHSSRYTDMDVYLATQKQHQIDAAKKANTLGSNSPERKAQLKEIGKALENGYRGNK